MNIKLKKLIQAFTYFFKKLFYFTEKIYLKPKKIIDLIDQIIVYLFSLLPEHARVRIIKWVVKSRIKEIHHAEKTKESPVHDRLS